MLAFWGVCVMRIRRHPYAVELSFGLKLPVEFRRVGARRWLMGYTEDMGSCGVRFRAGEWVKPDTRIEMVFRMPSADPCKLVSIGGLTRCDLTGECGAA